MSFKVKMFTKFTYFRIPKKLPSNQFLDNKTYSLALEKCCCDILFTNNKKEILIAKLAKRKILPQNALLGGRCNYGANIFDNIFDNVSRITNRETELNILRDRFKLIGFNFERRQFPQEQSNLNCLFTCELTDSEISNIKLSKDEVSSSVRYSGFKWVTINDIIHGEYHLSIKAYIKTLEDYRLMCRIKELCLIKEREYFHDEEITTLCRKLYK